MGLCNCFPSVDQDTSGNNTATPTTTKGLFAKDPSDYPIVERQFRDPVDYEDETNGKTFTAEITVMTYNFLSDRMATQEHHSYASLSNLDFNFRGPRILEEIKASDADILCLQEVDHWYDFYGARFTDLGYKYVFYKRKTVNKKEGEGIVLAFKEEKFKLLDRNFVDFDDLVK